MIVIRTSLKRRIAKTLFPVISAAAGFCAVMFLNLAPIGSYSAEENEFVSETEISNMNGNSPVLFTAVNEPVHEEANVRQDDKISEQAIAETPVETVPEPVMADENSSFSGKYLLTQNLSDSTDDISRFSVHSGAIYEETFGKCAGPEYIDLAGGGQLRNCTDFDNDTVVYRCENAGDISVKLYSEEPQVLIIHTHTTESYEPYTKDWYDEQYTSRSYDPEKSVVAVGDAIAEQLAAAGITVIHDCTVHDAVYSGSYSRSLETTTEIMNRYPSIKVVLDIHRDAIEYSDSSRVSAVTEIGGKKAAQVMIICAADDGTYDVPNFFGNLRFACDLQQSMEGMFPTLTRPILFQYCQYNQQVSTGALLIEVGSHGNSIDEAVYSGELIGRSLVSLLLENAVEDVGEAVPVIANMPIYFLDRLR